MEQALKTTILKKLKPQSRVKLTIDFSTQIKKGSIGFKIRNGKAPFRATQMLIAIGRGKKWFVNFQNLTCPAIEVMEQIEGQKK